MNSPEILKCLKNPSRLGETTLHAVEQMVKDYPWFQAGWMLYLKNLKNLNDPAFANLLSRVAIRVYDRKNLKNFLDTKEQVIPIPPHHEQMMEIPDYPIAGSGSEEMVKSDKSLLIENFLAQGARFNSPTPESQGEQPVDLAEKASMISNDIVSEKFAEILLEQEKFADAIASFQKLGVKYPEKSIYFATRIEEIRNLIISK